MAAYEGKCSQCGKTHYSHRKGDLVVCDCWRYCPLCCAEMTPYSPDLTANTYGVDGKSDLAIIMICSNHNPPFHSDQKPVEVVCE